MIGETIHSGPSFSGQKKGKDENLGCSSNFVFPGDVPEGIRASLRSSQKLLCQSHPHPHPHPSQHCQPRGAPNVPRPLPLAPSDNPEAAGTPPSCTATPAPKLPQHLTPRAPSPVGKGTRGRVDVSPAGSGDPSGPHHSLSTRNTQEKKLTLAKTGAALKKCIKTEKPEIPKIESTVETSLNALPKEPVEATHPEASLPEVSRITSRIKTETDITPTSQPYSPEAKFTPFVKPPSSPHASRNSTSDVSREMVRLIQEGDTKLDSFCHKRSSRASKRVNSAEFDPVLELKPEAGCKGKRCTRTRKTSCRSEKSESEASDSRSVADEAPYFDMVDKTAKQGKPKNGEPVLDEAATHISAKCNGEVSTEVVNGAHKAKGRRVSRVNSDESDSSSTSRSTGNVEQNGDKVDISVLLEISPADRKKFESKKAKIRRKTADWLLISETEQYYNEKEEIMRNKNKIDSDSESDGSDDDTENRDSKSDCSDESVDVGSVSKDRNKGKGKQSDIVDEDSRSNVKRTKDDVGVSRKGRPVGSRKRKIRYDLTMLNDDDDDDENFFGFPISTNIPQGGPGVSASCGLGHGRGKDGHCSSSSGKSGRKRLSDAERFLRDNREYYHFQETPERLRRSSSMGGEKDRLVTNRGGAGEEEEPLELQKKEENRPKEGLVVKKRLMVTDARRRVTRSTGVILEQPEEEEKERTLQKNSEKNDNKEKDESDARKKIADDEKRISLEEAVVKEEEDDTGNPTEEDSKISEQEKSNMEDIKQSNITEDRRKLPEESCSDVSKRKMEDSPSPKVMSPNSSEGAESSVTQDIEMRLGSNSELHGLYFSFEGIPEQESWYQTYQRLIDGVSDNEFYYEDEALKFVLPYEMPKEYVRDFLCYKKGLLSKKKNDLADLVRKSPRCHPSTMALSSDIIPTKKMRSVKTTRSTPVKIDEASSDGTSTPGADSTRTQPSESFETTEELAILALHIDHIMKSEIGDDDLCNHIDECKDSEETDLKKTPPKKRGKKKRLMVSSKPEKVADSSTKEIKLFESPLAQEVDPMFVAGLCDDMKDLLIPENILTREASEVIEDSFFCVCTDRASCDEFSSADDNTEVSSECVSLCDSETVDGSIASEPKPTRSAKKRRKNLTGWPKTHKKKRPAPSHTSDDNDSAIGWDDLEPKKQGCWKKHDFSLLEQTTSERLAALAACDRRASPRKKASVLYMDTWPVRFRTQK